MSHTLQSESSQTSNRPLHLALIPLGIGINIAIGTIVLLLKLPIYLDAIGTIIITMLAGLRAGLLTAVLTHLLAGYLVNPVMPYFIPTSAAIATYIHLVYTKGAFRTIWGTILAGIGLGIVTGVISAPIIVYVFGGVVATGRSLVTAYLASAGERILNAVLLSGLAAEPVDKTLQCLLSIWLLKGVPHSILDRFKGHGAGVQSATAVYIPETWTGGGTKIEQRITTSPIHPIARGLATLFGIAGTALADDIQSLVLVWLIVLIPLTITSGIMTKHLRMLGSVIIPLGLMLLALWGWLIGATPGMPPGSDPQAGALYAALIALKLTVFATVFQLCFLSIPQSQLLSTFWHWRIRGEYLIVAIGAFTIWPELKIRAEQILTARFARGLMPNRGFITRLRQVPFILRPLLVWSLRAAIQRSEFWGQRHLLQRISRIKHVDQGATVVNVAVVGLSILWLGYHLMPGQLMATWW